MDDVRIRSRVENGLGCMTWPAASRSSQSRSRQQRRLKRMLLSEPVQDVSHAPTTTYENCTVAASLSSLLVPAPRLLFFRPGSAVVSNLDKLKHHGCPLWLYRFQQGNRVRLGVVLHALPHHRHRHHCSGTSYGNHHYHCKPLCTTLAHWQRSGRSRTPGRQDRLLFPSVVQLRRSPLSPLISSGPACATLACAPDSPAPSSSSSTAPRCSHVLAHAPG